MSQEEEKFAKPASSNIEILANFNANFGLLSSSSSFCYENNINNYTINNTHDKLQQLTADQHQQQINKSSTSSREHFKQQQSTENQASPTTTKANGSARGIFLESSINKFRSDNSSTNNPACLGLEGDDNNDNNINRPNLHVIDRKQDSTSTNGPPSSGSTGSMNSTNLNHNNNSTNTTINNTNNQNNHTNNNNNNSSARSSSAGGQSSNVTAFLSKLWRLVNDQHNNNLICWSNNGCSFIISNQIHFAKDILPLYFKHSNMASFIRQLNMYGFRKIPVVGSNGSSLADQRTDVAQFYHVNFLRGQECRLVCIKRKCIQTYGQQPHTITNKGQSLVANRNFCDDVKAILNDLRSIRDGQNTSESILGSIEVDNKNLWRDVAVLRLQHQKQRRIVDRLIHFLLPLTQSNRNHHSTGHQHQAAALLGINGTNNTSKHKRNKNRLSINGIAHHHHHDSNNQMIMNDVELGSSSGSSSSSSASSSSGQASRSSGSSPNNSESSDDNAGQQQQQNRRISHNQQQQLANDQDEDQENDENPFMHHFNNCQLQFSNNHQPQHQQVANNHHLSLVSQHNNNTSSGQLQRYQLHHHYQHHQQQIASYPTKALTNLGNGNQQFLATTNGFHNTSNIDLMMIDANHQTSNNNSNGHHHDAITPERSIGNQKEPENCNAAMATSRIYIDSINNQPTLSNNNSGQVIEVDQVSLSDQLNNQTSRPASQLVLSNGFSPAPTALSSCPSMTSFTNGQEDDKQHLQVHQQELAELSSINGQQNQSGSIIGASSNPSPISLHHYANSLTIHSPTNSLGALNGGLSCEVLANGMHNGHSCSNDAIDKFNLSNTLYNQAKHLNLSLDSQDHRETLPLSSAAAMQNGLTLTNRFNGSLASDDPPVSSTAASEKTLSMPATNGCHSSVDYVTNELANAKPAVDATIAIMPSSSVRNNPADSLQSSSLCNGVAKIHGIPTISIDNNHYPSATTTPSSSQVDGLMEFGLSNRRYSIPLNDGQLSTINKFQHNNHNHQLHHQHEQASNLGVFHQYQNQISTQNTNNANNYGQQLARSMKITPSPAAAAAQTQASSLTATPQIDNNINNTTNINHNQSLLANQQQNTTFNNYQQQHLHSNNHTNQPHQLLQHQQVQPQPHHFESSLMEPNEINNSTRSLMQEFNSL